MLPLVAPPQRPAHRSSIKAHETGCPILAQLGWAMAKPSALPSQTHYTFVISTEAKRSGEISPPQSTTPSGCPNPPTPKTKKCRRPCGLRHLPPLQTLSQIRNLRPNLIHHRTGRLGEILSHIRHLRRILACLLGQIIRKILRRRNILARCLDRSPAVSCK